MSYNSSNFLQPLGSSKNIKILDNDGNLTFTIKPNLILDSFPDSNYLKILLKSGKEVKLDFLNIEDPILANTKLQQQIQFLLLNNNYDTSATQSIATNTSVTGDFYQYDNFLRPLTESDRNIKILKNLIVKYTIDPFSIINTSVSSNILNIAVKSERAISLDFSTHNEARLALIRLREQIDLLINKTPLLIDKDIANYIDSKILSGPTGATGPQGEQGIQGPTGATGPQGEQGIQGDRYSTTSSDTFSIPEVGITRDFIIGTGLAYTPSQTIIVSPNINPNDHFHAIINSYYPLTGSMSATCTEDNNIAGETYSAWTINLSGAVGVPGDIGPTGPQGIQGPTGPQGPQGIQGEIGPYFGIINFTHAEITPIDSTNYNFGGISTQPPSTLNRDDQTITSLFDGVVYRTSFTSKFTPGSSENSQFIINNITTGDSSIIVSDFKYGTSVVTLLSNNLQSGLPVGWTAVNVTFPFSYAYFSIPAIATLDTPIFDASAYPALTVNCDVAKFGSGLPNGPLTIFYSLDGGLNWISAGVTPTPTSATYLSSSTSIPQTSSTMMIRFSSVTSTTAEKRLRNVVILSANDVDGVSTIYNLNTPLLVNLGDKLAVRWTTPAWVTNPTAITNYISLKIESL